MSEVPLSIEVGFSAVPDASRNNVASAQGYLAHKKTHPPRTLP